MEYKSNRNVVYSCKYHVVWCPQYRRKVLVSGIKEPLKEILRTLADERRAEITEIEIMPDHVHLLVEVDLFRCECGFEADRDVNAAINIKYEGIKQLGIA